MATFRALRLRAGSIAKWLETSTLTERWKRRDELVGISTGGTMRMLTFCYTLMWLMTPVRLLVDCLISFSFWIILHHFVWFCPRSLEACLETTWRDHKHQACFLNFPCMWDQDVPSCFGLRMELPPKKSNPQVLFQLCRRKKLVHTFSSFFHGLLQSLERVRESLKQCSMFWGPRWANFLS